MYWIRNFILVVLLCDRLCHFRIMRARDIGMSPMILGIRAFYLGPHEKLHKKHSRCTKLFIPQRLDARSISGWRATFQGPETQCARGTQRSLEAGVKGISLSAGGAPTSKSFPTAAPMRFVSGNSARNVESLEVTRLIFVPLNV